MNWNENKEISQWAKNETVYNCEDVYCIKDSNKYYFKVSKKPVKRVILRPIANSLRRFADFLCPETIRQI